MKTAVERQEHPEGFAEVGTIEHEGRTFSAGGAYVDDHVIVAYLDPCERDAQTFRALRGLGPAFSGPLHNWGGEVIGRYVLTSTWQQYAPGAYHATRMYSVRMVLTDGRRYNGRSQGPGMIVKGRRQASQLKEGAK